MSIEIRNLTHIYMPGSPFEAKALDNVSLTIGDGEFVGIIGHTGSGKSTLITYMNALERAGAGHVFINGTDVGTKDADIRAIRREIGLVFQYPEYQLFEETIAGDIAFGPRNLGMDRKEIDRRVMRAMEMTGLDARLREESPFSISGGQKRRVAIAGVLAMEPSVLILDEPAAGLDPAGRRDMLDMIARIHQNGTTVVMVSHSMDDVGAYCSRLIVLAKGKIAFEGAPREVFAHGAELRKIGLDVPSCAALADALRENGFVIPEGAYTRAELTEAIRGNLNGGGEAHV